MILSFFLKRVHSAANEPRHQRSLSSLWFVFYYTFLRIRLQFQTALFWPLFSQEFCRLFPHTIKNQLHSQMTVLMWQQCIRIQVFHSR